MKMDPERSLNMRNGNISAYSQVSYLIPVLLYSLYEHFLSGNKCIIIIIIIIIFRLLLIVISTLSKALIKIFAEHSHIAAYAR